jgi:sec-independent protein translocase protein TatA
VPFGLGIWEIVVLLAVLALLFGTKGVPKMARKLGTSVKELKDSVGEIDPRSMFDPEPDEKPAEPKRAALPAAPKTKPPPARDDLSS